MLTELSMSQTNKRHLNKEKIKLIKQLPYLVSNVIEIVEPYIDPNEADGANKIHP